MWTSLNENTKSVITVRSGQNEENFIFDLF